VSALRFWETQGLLDPPRDPANGYRLYDTEQLRRLRVVVLLRTSGYRFEAIRAVLDQLAAGNAKEAITAAESRLKELEHVSQRRLKALATFWAYVQPAVEEP
jgi:DNA-binding transcriptional MerR regulator